MSDLPPSIGRYRIDGLLGLGAMGVVYKAHDPDIERTVAVKLIRTDLLEGADRADYVARFRSEARAVGRCVHPNIVGIHDMGSHAGSPFLVLEYVNGEPLGHHVSSRRRRGVTFLTGIMLQALNALAYAHSFGIVHRDVKPANILLGPGDTAKLTDFGISRALSSGATVSSDLVGTPSYMSPEQCRGGEIDGRSDLFSLACVFYELLSGQKAFTGPNYVVVTHRILREDPAPLLTLRSDLPPALASVIQVALSRDPAARFAGATEMAAALEAALPVRDRRLAAPAPAPAAPDDATVVAPARIIDDGLLSFPIGILTGLGSLGSTTLSTIERRLAHHVGPIARLHLTRAMRDAADPEDLCARLAAMVAEGTARDTLLAETRALVAADDSLRQQRSRSDAIVNASAHRAIPAVVSDGYARALASVLGPIAQVVVRRALRNAASVAELEAACISAIDDPGTVARFQRELATERETRSRP